MKPFTSIAFVVFLCVAMLQMVRVVLKWDIVINGVSVPIWVSIVAFVVAGVLAFMLRREARA